MSNFQESFLYAYQVFATFSPLILYFPQYFVMKSNQSVGSFNKMICIILLLSSILKLIYYIGHQYDFCLFTQAIFNIGVQIFLLYQFFFYQNLEQTQGYLENNLVVELKAKRALKNLLIFTLIFSGVYLSIFLLKFTEWIIEFTGAVAALLETLVPLPQFYSNFRQKSTKGLSQFMIYCWLGGDIIRFFFYIIDEQPFQFIFFNGIQIFFDLGIIYQFSLYKIQRMEYVKDIRIRDHNQKQ